MVAAKASPVLTQCKPPGGLLCLSINARGLQDRKPHPYLGPSRVVWWGNQLRAEIGIIDSLVKTDADNKAPVQDAHSRL